MARILFVVNEALFFTTHRMPIALALIAAGHQVDVAAPPDEKPAAKIRAAGINFHPIPLGRGSRNPLGELKLILAIAGVLRRTRPDLAHFVSMKPVIWGGMLARLMGVRAAVFAVTGLGYMFIREGLAVAAQRTILAALYRFALGHANSRTIFQNDDDRDTFLIRRMVDPAKIVMIRGCGVALDQFRASPEPPDADVVMFPARLIGDKGVREFVTAVQRLKPRYPQVRFVLVGRTDPQNPTALSEAEIARMVAAGDLEWWGFSADMPTTLAQATIVVLPSYREGLPRGLIEAAACQRAIVTTDVPGCRDVVRHEVNGLLVPVRDGEATATAIARLLDAPALRHRLAAAGRQIAEAEFSVEGFVEQSLAAYRAVGFNP